LVHSQLTAGRRRSAAIATALVLVLALATPALAANRRISISHYAWSVPNIQINLDEHVTWYWIGPDTMHSITGTGADSQPVDSDPGTDTPRHQIGDTFKVSFDQPGTYEFHCKLHPFVRGTVTVSPTPGDPSSEADPVPKSNVDLKAPYIDGVALAKTSFGADGTTLRYGTDEAVAKLDAEIYRRGKRHLHFAGWRVWKGGHVGYNRAHFGDRSSHFTAAPGKYRAFVRATDSSQNESHARNVDFTIR
jgi:plastocyanin